MDEADSSYEKRKKIFIYRDKMMEFAKKIMPVLHPQIWDEFQLSLHDRDYTLEDALILVFGQQRYYEKQTVNGTNQRPKLDVYLCQRIKDRLDAWKDEKRKPEIEEIVDEEEYFVIPIWQY